MIIMLENLLAIIVRLIIVFVLQTIQNINEDQYYEVLRCHFFFSFLNDFVDFD